METGCALMQGFCFKRSLLGVPTKVAFQSKVGNLPVERQMHSSTPTCGDFGNSYFLDQGETFALVE